MTDPTHKTDAEIDRAYTSAEIERLTREGKEIDPVKFKAYHERILNFDDHDPALGKDWPVKLGNKLEHTENLLFSARETIKRLEAELVDISNALTIQRDTAEAERRLRDRAEAELHDRKNLDPARHCFSRAEAEKVAEAWLAERKDVPPDYHWIVNGFIRDTYPVAREAGKVWEAGA